MTSKFEGYRFDAKGNIDPKFPKVVNTQDVTIAGQTFQVYERPDFIAEITPILDEIDRQSHFTPAPGEKLRVRILVVTGDGYIGEVGVN